MIEPVYGPVKSWRYGKSLGIDAIGAISTCSFNCVYCQLGEIEHPSRQRQEFVPTAKIIDLASQQNWAEIDTVTLSGSGEPTLANNLGEILAQLRQLTQLPLVVLTNGTLLHLPEVRLSLQLATEVSVKLDGATPAGLMRISRPSFDFDWEEFSQGIGEFRSCYQGRLTLQTMVTAPWSATEQAAYITHLQQWLPDAVYLNRPSRPKPRHRLLQGRENLEDAPDALWFKPVALADLSDFAETIYQQTALKVFLPPSQ